MFEDFDAQAWLTLMMFAIVALAVLAILIALAPAIGRSLAPMVG